MKIRTSLPLALGLIALPCSPLYAASTFFTHTIGPDTTIAVGGTESYSGSMDLISLTGIDILSGQYLITDARFIFVYDQSAFMAKPLSSPEYLSFGTNTDLISAGLNPVDYGGTTYPYEVVFDHRETFRDQQASASAILTVGPKTGSSVFGHYTRGLESAAADSFAIPDNTTGLIERHRYWNEYIGPGPQGSRHFLLDPLGLHTDANGVLSFSATATNGELSLISLNLSFNYEENPFWQPPAPPAAVPVPGAVWLFGSGLLGLVGLARRRQIER